MNLLYTLTTYPPSMGGAQLHQHLLAQEMHKKHDVQVVSHWNKNRTDWLLGTTLRSPSVAEDYVIDGINVHRLGMDSAAKMRLLPSVLSYYPAMQFALPRIAAQLEQRMEPYAVSADLIHNVRIGREGLSYASYQLARRHGIPFVLTPVHHPRWRGWRYRMYEEIYRGADMVIALTNAEKVLLQSLGVAEERIAVTGVGPVLADHASPDDLTRALGIDGPMVLFVGQHYRYKGFSETLAAMPKVWRTAPDAHFVFIGPPIGNSETYFDGIDDRRVHRLGAVSLQEKTNALAACSLLCVPSTQESFGGVYTEAWSFGKPVIGGNIPPIADVIADGHDGYLVDQEPEQIADRIIDLLQYPDRAQAMGEAGHRKVEGKYQWAQLAQSTEKVYACARMNV